MYIVTVYHHDKDWVKGDLEDKFELIDKESFKTRKAAKDYIERQLSRRRGSIYREYHTGDKTSYCYCHTGVKWIHENTGEEMREYYQYTLKKAKLK